MSSGQCHRYNEYAIAPSATSGAVANSRFGSGNPSLLPARACRLAPARIISMVAPTGTSAHGPGNSWTPSMKTPQDRIAASATVATTVRSHLGQRT